MNRSKDASRANWIALFALMFVLLGALLMVVYFYVLAPEFARRAEFRRQQRIAEVIERHGGAVEWIGVDYGNLFDFMNVGAPHEELLPTAIFANPQVDLFSASKPRQPEKKTPVHLIQRSPFRASPELFAALRELNPDTLYFHRTDFNSNDFANLKGLTVTTFIASETLLDDRAANSIDCFGPYLEYIGLEYSLIGDAFIEQLCKTTRVMKLNIEGTKVTGKCAAALAAQTHLDDLNLAHTDFDDAGLALLEKCKALRTLDISHTKVTRQGLANFKPPPSLVQIEVAGLELPPEADKWTIDNQMEVIGRAEPAIGPEK